MQMLLDPFEEQFDLSARLVQCADGGRRQGEIVGQEHQCLAGFGIVETDPEQMLGIILGAGHAGERDGLVADDAGAAIDRRQIDAPQPDVRFGAGNEEGLHLTHHVKPGKVQIAPNHDVDRAGFRHQHIELEFARQHDQIPGKLGMNLTVLRLVGIGHRRALDLPPESHVVPLGRLRREADLDIAQALRVGQLCEGHHSELFGASEQLDVAVAIAVIDNSMKSLPRQEVRELGEQCLAKIHGSLRLSKTQKPAGSTTRRSSRRHPSSLGNPLQSWL